MPAEIRIDHDRINDPNRVTSEVAKAYREHGLDPKVHIPLDVQDDPHRKQRIIKIRNTKVFDMGRRSAR